ncbi:MAG: hypothetical protein H6977_10200 [Gammaproteobacteria bacterium]|nr:hypothetical protein [Gammaproteobacteria bacterium]MCP5200377.1 hypothetical protein [Gammaproteobacteria bacterium]
MTSNPVRSTAFILGLCLAIPAGAAGVASESRDSSAAFVATQNFIVGRLGRDCLELLGRKESAAEYQQQWQRNNARYHDAAARYMAARLAEIELDSERDAIEAAYYDSVNKTGTSAVAQMLDRGDRVENCRVALTLVDAGNMDIDKFVVDTKQPLVAARLEELVKWAQKR